MHVRMHGAAAARGGDDTWQTPSTNTGGSALRRPLAPPQASALAVGGAGWSEMSCSGAGAVAAALPGGSVVLLEPVWGRDG